MILALGVQGPGFNSQTGLFSYKGNERVWFGSLGLRGKHGRPVGLGVWFSLRVREVPGSNPGWALQRSTRQVQLLPPPGHQPHTHRLIGFFGTYRAFNIAFIDYLQKHQVLQSLTPQFCSANEEAQILKAAPWLAELVVAGVAREDKSEPQPATTKLTLTLTWLLRHQTHLAALRALKEAMEKTMRGIFSSCVFLLPLLLKGPLSIRHMDL